MSSANCTARSENGPNLTAVQKVLQEEFCGRPISEQNLSEWRQGGYAEWLQLEDHRALLGALHEEAATLEADSGSTPTIDLVTTHRIGGVARCLREFSATALDHPFKLDSFLAVTRAIANLHRLQLERERLRLKRDQWEAKQAEAAKAAQNPADPASTARGRKPLSFAQITGLIDAYHAEKIAPEYQRPPFPPINPNQSGSNPSQPAAAPVTAASTPAPSTLQPTGHRASARPLSPSLSLRTPPAQSDRIKPAAPAFSNPQSAQTLVTHATIPEDQ